MLFLVFLYFLGDIEANEFWDVVSDICQSPDWRKQELNMIPREINESFAFW